jgi:UPF0716 protein FxsA
MGLALLGLMIVVPILEIAVFILVGRYIGLWPTLAGILLTALIGTLIIRHQGTGLIAAAKKSIAAGEAPVGEVLQGLALLVAGALLITPGFITDTLGFLVLVPALRRRLAATLLAQATRRAETQMRAARTAAGSGAGGRPGADVILEGEWREVEPHDGDVGRPQPGRGWDRVPGAGMDDDTDDVPPARRAGG